MLRADVEDFLYHEAALLDHWQLNEWAELFTDDGEYLVPSTSLPADADPTANLFFIYDDRFRLEQRAKRLMKRTAHAEYPPSKTRHMVSNVRVLEGHGDEVTADCAFVVYRAKREFLDIYPGSAKYRLVRRGDGFRIRRKLAALDLDALRPQGKISIIL